MRSVHASVVALVVAIAFACDRSPTAVPTPALQASRSNPSPAPSSSGKHSGLVVCSQTYDSVTQVIGPKGGTFAVGPHYLFVDSLALDRKSTRLNSSHGYISYAVFCLKKKKHKS